MEIRELSHHQWIISFIEHLLFIKHYTRFWGYKSEQNRKNVSFPGALFWGYTERGRPYNANTNQKKYGLWRVQLDEITRRGHNSWAKYCRCLVREGLSEEVTFKVKLKREGGKKSPEADVRAPTVKVEGAWWRSVRETLGGGEAAEAMCWGSELGPCWPWQ